MADIINNIFHLHITRQTMQEEEPPTPEPPPSQPPSPPPPPEEGPEVYIEKGFPRLPQE